VTGVRARLILNPAAGADTADERSGALNERLSSGFGPMEIVLTSARGDAEKAARRAVTDGCTILFVGGGDGTLNEVLNGVVLEHALPSTTLGIIPLGTGNDFAKAVGLPLDVDEALTMLLRNERVQVDVGRANGRCFVNTSGAGFIAEVSEAVTPQMKTIAGRLAYLVGGAQALLEFEPVTMTLTTTPDSHAFTTRMYAFAACNSPLIGGGRLIAPHAAIDDGLLDFCVIEAMPALEFVALLRRVAKGEHVEDSRVRYFQASTASVRFEREILINTDGEILPARTCEYDVLPRAATFLAGDRYLAAVGNT
jgi:diacylglycerol kinase (ATP)